MAELKSPYKGIPTEVLTERADQWNGRQVIVQRANHWNGRQVIVQRADQWNGRQVIVQRAGWKASSGPGWAEKPLEALLRTWLG